MAVKKHTFYFSEFSWFYLLIPGFFSLKLFILSFYIDYQKIFIVIFAFVFCPFLMIALMICLLELASIRSITVSDDKIVFKMYLRKNVSICFKDITSVKKGLFYVPGYHGNGHYLECIELTTNLKFKDKKHINRTSIPYGAIFVKNKEKTSYNLQYINNFFHMLESEKPNSVNRDLIKDLIEKKQQYKEKGKVDKTVLNKIEYAKLKDNEKDKK